MLPALLIFIALSPVAAHVSLAAYCAQKSSRHYPEVSEPIICPKTAWQVIDASYFCPRLIRNATAEDEIRFVHQRKKWKARFAELNDMLATKNASVAMIGDSLTGTSYRQYHCLMEFSGYRGNNRVISLQGGGYLSKLNPRYWSAAPVSNWFDEVVRRGVKLIIFNTGAWWSSAALFRANRMKTETGLHHIMTQAELLEAYRQHFHRDGELAKMLHKLQHEHGVITLWRDTAPGGKCGKEPVYDHNLFDEYNTIARAELLGKLNITGAIPNIWEESLPYSLHHISETDVLHYCIYQEHSAQSKWVEIMIDSIHRYL